MRPRLSIVLVDWSVRESLHILKYLKNQRVPREVYEILWIEFYDRRHDFGNLVDRHVVLEMPKNVTYHKHFMYNVGIQKARGEIVLICDSDAIVEPTFVDSVLKMFDKKPGIVLHLDQVRNKDQRFYPFRYPKIPDILGKGVMNWKNGTTTGLTDTTDPLHKRNYGACMAARRADLLMIGGADEHVNYLGQCCGPYEMTFRLINQGLKEFWHPKEFLYHVWHPGVGGKDNYCGPHDGKMMSTRALAVTTNGQRMPYVAHEEPLSSQRMNEWTRS